MNEDTIKATAAKVEDIISGLGKQLVDYKRGVFRNAASVFSEECRRASANELYLLATQLLEETAKLACLEKGEKS